MMRNRQAATRPRNSMQFHTTRRDGFALLSLLVAVVLLATGVMAIGAANTTRIRVQTLSGVRTTALSIARAQVEAVRGRDPWTLVSIPAEAVDNSGAARADGAYTREVQVTVESTNLLRVVVIVTAPRLSTPVRLVTNTYRGSTMTPRS
jgi:Tfp pilus assembly protein PilV